MNAHGWLTTTLILLPLGGALLVWLLPMPRVWLAPLAAADLAVRGRLLDRGARPLRLRQGRAPGVDAAARWFSDLGVSYHVGMFDGFSLWLVGLTVVVMAAAIAYGVWVGRDRPRAYFGLMLFLTGAIVGVFTRAGPAALLRLLGGDADPALRPDRRVGRAGPAGRDDQVRRLHDGRARC